ncbi:serine hydrolase [Roseburia hominis]
MKKKVRWLAGILAVVLAVVGIPVRTAKAVDEESFDTTAAPVPKETKEEEENTKKAYEMKVESNELTGWPKGPQTYGEAGIVLEAKSGAILYSKNIDGKAYPASITKILTALVALENKNVEDKITITQESIDFLEYGDAHIGLTPGEEITLNDALYALLLASANEVAYAIGANTGEGYDWFLQQMNTRAKELGAVNSHFVNTNGLQDTEHYTTARDMALITRELLLNHKEFSEISQTKEYRIPATNLVSEERVFQQKHQMFYDWCESYDSRVVAGKTGYTDDALNTLVTCTDDGNMKLICVVLKTHGRNVYPNTKNLLDYGYDNFQKVEIAGKEKSEDIESMEEGAYVVLPSGIEFESLKMELVTDEENASTGTAIYTYEGNPVGSVKVAFSEAYLKKNAPEEVEKDKDQTEKNAGNVVEKVKESIPEWVYWVLKGFGILIGLLAIWLVIAFCIRKKRRKERQKRREMRRRRRRR